MQYDKIKLIVGSFVITLLFVIIASLYLFISSKGLFTQRYSYSFNTQSAKSFSIGMPLKVSGFKIGTLEEMALKDNGVVNMRFSVDEKNRKWISEGTVLKIIKPFIGTSYIEVYSQPGREPLKPNSLLKIIQSDDINDIVAKSEPLINKIIHIIDSIDVIASYLASSDSELITTLENLDKFSTKLVQDDSLLTTLTGDKESTKLFITTLQELNKTMHELAEISKNLNTISSSLHQDIIKPSSQSLYSLDAILKDVKRKLEVVNGSVNAIGSYDTEILQLKEEIAIAIKKSNQILEKVDGVLSEKSEKEVTLP